VPGQLHVRKLKKVVIAEIAHPERLNAIDSALRTELQTFWEDFASNSDLSVAVLTGEGDRSFCVGLDLKEAAGQLASGASITKFTHLHYPRNHRMGKVVIAAINGLCVGGGLLLALGCDIRVCSRNATFANPQARHGRPSLALLALEQAGVPRAVAMDMALTGESFDAESALRFGLVSRVYEDRRALLEAATQMAAIVTEQSASVVTGIKKACENGLLDLPFAQALPLWTEINDLVLDVGELNQRARAFGAPEGRTDDCDSRG